MTDAPPPYPGINGYSASAPYAAPLGAGGFVIPGGAQGGATGGSNTNGADAKAAEAAGLQTGYVDPNNPQMAYLPQVHIFHNYVYLNLIDAWALKSGIPISFNWTKCIT